MKAAMRAAKNGESPAPEPESPISSAPPADKQDGKTAEVTDTPESQSAPPAVEGKTAEKTDASGDVQETEKPRRNRKAEEKIAELTAAEAREKKRADDLAKELEDLRKTSAAPATKVDDAPKPEGPKAAEFKPAVYDKQKPTMKDFEERAAKGEKPYADMIYSELQDHWVEAVADWRDGKKEHEAAQSKAAEDFKKAEAARAAQAQTAEQREARVGASIKAAKSKYSDFDQIIQKANQLYPEGNNGIRDAFLRIGNAGDVIYALAKEDAKEYARIHKLSEDDAMDEVMELSRRLRKAETTPTNGHAAPPKPVEKPVVAAAPPPPPEKPKPAVSKAPEPYVVVGGAEAPSQPIAGNWMERKRQQHRRA
jgi:hypothetical protein